MTSFVTTSTLTSHVPGRHTSSQLSFDGNIRNPICATYIHPIAKSAEAGLHARRITDLGISRPNVESGVGPTKTSVSPRRHQERSGIFRQHSPNLSACSAQASSRTKGHHCSVAPLAQTPQSRFDGAGAVSCAWTWTLRIQSYFQLHETRGPVISSNSSTTMIVGCQASPDPVIFS